MIVVTVNRVAQLLFAVALAVTGSGLYADDRITDLEVRAEQATLEAQAALEFSTRFRQMAEKAMDEVYFLPTEQRPDALEHAARLRNAAARARATWHRLDEFSSEIRTQLLAASARAPEVERLSDYDYRIVDAITSEIVDAAIIVEVPTPVGTPPPAPRFANHAVVTEEPNSENPRAFESAPVPEKFPEDHPLAVTTGSIGPVPGADSSALEAKALHARDLANKALNFAVEIQVEAEQAAANLSRFKNFRGKVDKAQFDDVKKKAALLTEEARLAELEYQLLDSRAADLEAEFIASTR